MESYKEEILKFTNEELKDNIIKLNKEKLEGIRKSSYLNAFNSIISLNSVLEDDKKTSYLNKISETNELKKYVGKAIKLIKDSIKEKVSNEYLEEALEIRKNLYDLSKATEGYFIELSYIEQRIEQYKIGIASKSYSKEKNLMVLSTKELITLIEKALEVSKKDYEKYNYIISNIVYALPMRFTKDKYFNIIKRALTRNLEGLSKLEIEDRLIYYKRQWDSSLQYGYGVYFNYYFTEIEKLKKIDFKKKSLEELKEISESLIPLRKDLNELYNFILILGLTYNMIISIMLNEEIGLPAELEETSKLWEESIDSNDEKKISEFLILSESKIEENEKEIMSSLSEFEELNKEALRREDFEESELNHIFLYTRKILTYYNDYNLSNLDLLFSTDDEEVSSFYLEQAINSLTQYMSRTMPKMSNIERKVRMKKVLSLVELPFANIIEFKDYIKYSLDKRNSSQGEIEIITNNIVNFLSNLSNMDKKE